jgi:hypothetical protein
MQGPLPDDDVLSAVVAWIQRDIGLHHKLNSASTTTSSASASSRIPMQWWQPKCFFFILKKIIFGVG